MWRRPGRPAKCLAPEVTICLQFLSIWEGIGASPRNPGNSAAFATTPAAPPWSAAPAPPSWPRRPEGSVLGNGDLASVRRRFPIPRGDPQPPAPGTSVGNRLQRAMHWPPHREASKQRHKRLGCCGLAPGQTGRSLEAACSRGQAPARGLITTRDIKGTAPTPRSKRGKDSAGEPPRRGGACAEAPGGVTERAVRGQQPCFK